MTDKEKLDICEKAFHNILRIRGLYWKRDIIKNMREIAQETLDQIEE